MDRPLVSQENLEQIQGRLQKLQAQLAYLFGSAARGTEGPLSDIDMALLLDAPHTPSSYLERRLEATVFLMHLFHVPRVDVVVLNEATPLLQFRVIQEGKLLFESDPRIRIAFETKAIQRFCDTQPLRTSYDEALLSAIRMGRFYG